MVSIRQPGYPAYKSSRRRGWFIPYQIQRIKTSCLYETCATSHRCKTLPYWANRSTRGHRYRSRKTPSLANGQAPQVSQKHSIFGELKFSRHLTCTQQLAFPLHHRSTSQQYMQNHHRYIAIEFTNILFGRPHINISSVRTGIACRNSKICISKTVSFCAGQIVIISRQNPALKGFTLRSFLRQPVITFLKWA